MRRRYTTTKAALFGGGRKAVPLTTLDQFMDWMINEEGGRDARSLYKAVAWAFWCVNRRANAVAGMPYLILPLGVEKDDPDLAVEWGFDLRPTLWAAEAWLSLKGAAYALKRMEGATISKLQMLNAYSMRVVEYDADGPTLFEQQANGKRKLYAADELLYFRNWNPSDDINEGTPPSQPASAPSLLIDHANEWASSFFENGAVPLVLLTADGVVPDVERERIRGTWNEWLQGVKNAFRTMILGHGIKPEILTPPLKDLAMPELEVSKRHQILAAYGLPPGLAEAKTNSAEHQAQKAEAYEECYIPECEIWIEPVLNEQLFNPLGLRLSFQYGQIEVMQQQELAKAESSSFLVTGIMKSAYESNVVSLDEYRAWIGEIGAWSNMPPLEENFEPEERTPPQLQPFTGEESSGDEGPGAPTPVDERIESRLPKALVDDLDRWERKAITRIREGHPLKALEFASDAIPAVMHRMIVHSLEHATTLGDVVEVFKAARGEKQIQFIPEGQGDPLPPIPAEVHISESDIDRAIRDWDKHLPDFAGLLDADVTHRENYDAESLGLG